MKNLNMATKINVPNKKKVLSPSNFTTSKGAQTVAAFSSATMVGANFNNTLSNSHDSVKSSTIPQSNASTERKGANRMGSRPFLDIQVRAPLRWEDEVEEVENLAYNDEIAAVENQPEEIPLSEISSTRRFSPFELGHPHVYIEDDGYVSSEDEKCFEGQQHGDGSHYPMAYHSSSSMSSSASAMQNLQLQYFDSPQELGNNSTIRIDCIRSIPQTNHATRNGRSKSLFMTSSSPLSNSSGSPISGPACSPRTQIQHSTNLHQRSQSFGAVHRFKSFTDRSLQWNFRNELKTFQQGNELVEQVQRGVDAGYTSIPVDSPCTGGVYFLKGPSGRFAAVLKPCDEEAYANHNPNGYVQPNRARLDRSKTIAGFENNQSYGSMASSLNSLDAVSNHDWGMKQGVRIGEAAIREAAAFALDYNGFAGVPNTTIVIAKPKDKSCGWRSVRRASLQAYESHECSAEDVGPNFLPTNSLHRIAVLDIRLYNMDRHSGNILLRTERDASLDADDNDVKHLRSGAFSPNQAFFSRSTSNGISPFVVENQISTSGISGRLMRQKSKSFHENDLTTNNALVKLIPIDHGYCLPSIYDLGEVDFAWMQWSQTKQVVDDFVVDFVQTLDPFADCQNLRNNFGSQISEDCFLTLVVCTILLKSAIKRDISLFDIGTMMCPGFSCDFHLCVPKALQKECKDSTFGLPLLQQVIEASGLPEIDRIEVPTDGSFLHDVDVDWINVESGEESEESLGATRRRETMDFLKRFYVILEESLDQRDFLLVESDQSWPQASSF